MLRILQVTPTYFSDASVIGGGERYVHNVCAAVTTAAQRNSARSDMLSLGRERTTIVLTPETDLHLIPCSPDDMLSCSGETLDALIDTYDVVHVHQCLLSWGIFIAARARLAGKIVLGTDHGGGENGLIEAYPLLGGQFDMFHAQAQFATGAFLQMNTPVCVIYGPVDETLFPLQSDTRDHTSIVMLGRVMPHKGYEQAIEALPANARLTIVGHPAEADYLSFLKARALGRQVRFEPELDDAELAQLLGWAGLYLHTGTHHDYAGDFYYKPELLGLAPLEAMSAGTPAIVSTAGALPELGRLVGCRVFHNRLELANMLEAHVAGGLFDATPNEIRAHVVKFYGLKQFGRAYLEMIAELRTKMAA
jgi:glycosyltransferase involved in cell wall biosynthesis